MHLLVQPMAQLKKYLKDQFACAFKNAFTPRCERDVALRVVFEGKDDSDFVGVSGKKLKERLMVQLIVHTAVHLIACLELQLKLY